MKAPERGTRSPKYRDWLEETWAIKERIYQETKHLQGEELLAYFRKHAEASPTWTKLTRRARAAKSRTKRAVAK